MVISSVKNNTMYIPPVFRKCFFVSHLLNSFTFTLVGHTENTSAVVWFMIALIEKGSLLFSKSRVTVLRPTIFGKPGDF